MSDEHSHGVLMMAIGLKDVQALVKDLENVIMNNRPALATFYTSLTSALDEHDDDHAGGHTLG